VSSLFDLSDLDGSSGRLSLGGDGGRRSSEPVVDELLGVVLSDSCRVSYRPCTTSWWGWSKKSKLSAEIIPAWGSRENSSAKRGNDRCSKVARTLGRHDGKGPLKMYYTKNRTTPISLKSRRKKFSRNSGESQKHGVVGEEDSPVILPGLGRQRGE
jgi:hypothetical protein